MIDTEKGVHLKKLPNGVLYIWFYTIGQLSSFEIGRNISKPGCICVDIADETHRYVSNIKVSDTFYIKDYTLSYIMDKNEVTIVCVPKQIIKESKYSSIPVIETVNKTISKLKQNKNGKKNFV